jgi:hypothetical protein
MKKGDAFPPRDMDAQRLAWMAWLDTRRALRHIRALYAIMMILFIVGFAFGSIAYYLYSVR